MRIRPAQPSDLPALSALYRRCLERADWFPAAALAEIDFAADTRDELVLVADDAGDRLLGFIGVWEPDSFIHHLYVEEGQRGKGVGKALLASIAGQLRYPWRLKCVVQNEAAYRFYTSQGWREIERALGARGEYALMQFDPPRESSSFQGAAMTVLLFASDLMTLSQASGVASASGAKVTSVASAAALAEKLQGEQVAAVIFDIDHARGELPALVAAVRAAKPEARIAAFGPHVREDALAAAQAAGCDLVLTRGQFLKGMPAVFQELLKARA